MDRGDVEADERGRFCLGTRCSPLPIRPLEITTADDFADFLLGSLPDVAEPDFAGDAVLGHAVRAARADRIKLLEERSTGALPGIVVRDEIALRVTVRPARGRGGGVARLASDRVAAGRILIDVEAKDAGEEACVHALAGVVLIIRTAFIADREVEESVETEEKAAPVVPVVPVVLIDQDVFRRRGDRIRRRIPGEAREAAIGPVRIRLLHRETIIDVEVVPVRRTRDAELRVESETHHATVVGRLDLVADVDQHRLRRSGLDVVENGETSGLLHDHEPVGEGHRHHLYRIDEGEVGEGIDEPPAPCRGTRGAVGEGAIEKRPDGFGPVESARGLGGEVGKEHKRKGQKAGGEGLHTKNLVRSRNYKSRN